MVDSAFETENKGLSSKVSTELPSLEATPAELDPRPTPQANNLRLVLGPGDATDPRGMIPALPRRLPRLVGPPPGPHISLMTPPPGSDLEDGLPPLCLRPAEPVERLLPSNVVIFAANICTLGEENGISHCPSPGVVEADDPCLAPFQGCFAL